ncbi:glycosyltransferase family 2 protein [Roseococcus sp. YIM B11640]|uniref:glycosyltransferase family 2 protein n=1 Tax=Roseococcus sp. YIM B11640 TaxID=3133973 RepID=UPI003C7C9F24
MSRYALIVPCRDEAATLRTTLDSILAQSILPAELIVVDDGSTDATPQILAEYAPRMPFLRVVPRDRGGPRRVGPGVVEAFNQGWAALTAPVEFVCKLDADLDLPPRYFETLMEIMDADPSIATCSGKPYLRVGPEGRMVAETSGDEISVGMTKFYRQSRLRELGGFVQHVGWDVIDCHSCRMRGWKAQSMDRPELRFIHLRQMGSSHLSIWEGRKRHGRGAWYLGTIPLFMLVSLVYRLGQRPMVLGSMFMGIGYLGAWLGRAPRYDAPGYLDFVAAYQWRALYMGKARAAETMRERALRALPAAATPSA